jgi:ribonuclease-3
LTRSPESLAENLGYRFDDLELLQRALTHRSSGKKNNERLEFLGDAVLGCVIAAEIYRLYPKAREGELSRLRASLVRRESLAGLAQSLDIGSYLRLGPGERKSGGHHRNSILADSLEAVLGAIYLDGGFVPCRDCILALFADRLSDLTDLSELKDPKTRLQEFLQSRQQALPEYTVVETTGDAHDQRFRVQCRISDADTPLTEGVARNRRNAEQKAAAQMLEQLEAG